MYLISYIPIHPPLGVISVVTSSYPRDRGVTIFLEDKAIMKSEKSGRKNEGEAVELDHIPSTIQQIFPPEIHQARAPINKGTKLCITYENCAN